MTLRRIDLQTSDESVTVVTGCDDADIMISVDVESDGVMVGLTAAEAKQLIGELTLALLEIGA